MRAVNLYRYLFSKLFDKTAITAIFIYLISLLLAFAFPSFFEYTFKIKSYYIIERIAVVGGAILTLFLLYRLMLSYLESSNNKVSNKINDGYIFEDTNKGSQLIKDYYGKLNMAIEKLEKLEKANTRLTSNDSIFSEEDRVEIKNNVKDRINELTSESIIESIDQKYGKAIWNSEIFKYIENSCGQTRERIMREIGKLGSKANLNLIIGILTTGIALTILGYTALNYKVDSSLSFIEEMSDMLPYFIFRLTLVVFIEIFSFFFLKLYKTSLAEIKYYQNEMTNLESHFISLKLAVLKKDETSMKMILEELAKTERNRILKKGDSTIEIEKSKHEGNKLIEGLKAFSGILEKVKLTTKS